MNAIATALNTDYGFSEAAANEIVGALGVYVKSYGNRWKDALKADWMRAHYPLLNGRRAGVMQAVRNLDASDYVMSLTKPQIMAALALEE